MVSKTGGAGGPAINPLTGEHRECLEAIIASAADTLDLIRRCKACGIDLGNREERLLAQRDFAKAALAQFFPD